MTPATTGLAQSVHTRLVAHAKRLGTDPNLVLTRYAVERFLYRLSRSRHAEQFVLKGALLLLAWLGETIRPTRDADLLGLESLTDVALRELFAEICDLVVEADGMAFDASSVSVSAIRPENAYGGFRITLRARLGNARLRVRVDVGFGDAVTPPPRLLDYPCLLEFPSPRLRAYSVETTIAEKVHTMVALGPNNSRMRDFYDVFVLAKRRDFRGDPLVRALRATFERRRTAFPDSPPLLLIAESPHVAEKGVQWRAFLAKSALRSAPEEFGAVVSALAGFVVPVITAAREGKSFDSRWIDGGPWRSADWKAR
ncbi:MAG TPA: nucleotidyl transferase AbiEii/AbiGii toxin family protein [Gemmatimonadaceae bacterium]|nr:nucleotidyl transferase AbiEii/AbiGii toxin family protein [Gemmatimonadaceae bacterium]